VDALNNELGTSVDRRSIVGEPLRQLGEHQVTVRLSRDYQPQVLVYIHPEGDQVGVEEEIVAEAELVEEAESEEIVEETADIEEVEESEETEEAEEVVEA
jgi:hypothetical protein